MAEKISKSQVEDLCLQQIHQDANECDGQENVQKKMLHSQNPTASVYASLAHHGGSLVSALDTTFSIQMDC